MTKSIRPKFPPHSMVVEYILEHYLVGYRYDTISYTPGLWIARDDNEFSSIITNEQFENKLYFQIDACINKISMECNNYKAGFNYKDFKAILKLLKIRLSKAGLNNPKR